MDKETGGSKQSEIDALQADYEGLLFLPCFASLHFSFFPFAIASLLKCSNNFDSDAVLYFYFLFLFDFIFYFVLCII